MFKLMVLMTLLLGSLGADLSLHYNVNQNGGRYSSLPSLLYRQPQQQHEQQQHHNLENQQQQQQQQNFFSKPHLFEQEIQQQQEQQQQHEQNQRQQERPQKNNQQQANIGLLFQDPNFQKQNIQFVPSNIAANMNLKLLEPTSKLDSDFSQTFQKGFITNIENDNGVQFQQMLSPLTDKEFLNAQLSTQNADNKPMQQILKTSQNNIQNSQAAIDKQIGDQVFTSGIKVQHINDDSSVSEILQISNLEQTEIIANNEAVTGSTQQSFNIPQTFNRNQVFMVQMKKDDGSSEIESFIPQFSTNLNKGTEIDHLSNQLPFQEIKTLPAVLNHESQVNSIPQHSHLLLPQQRLQFSPNPITIQDSQRLLPEVSLDPLTIQDSQTLLPETSSVPSSIQDSQTLLSEVIPVHSPIQDSQTLLGEVSPVPSLIQDSQTLLPEVSPVASEVLDSELLRPLEIAHVNPEFTTFIQSGGNLIPSDHTKPIERPQVSVKSIHIPIKNNIILDSSHCAPGLLVNLNGECVEPQITRNVFLYAAPKIQRRFRARIVAPKPKLEYNIVFVRNPVSELESEPIVIPPPQQKTLVYVLNRKIKAKEQGIIQAPSHAQLQPEVYFVNYADGDNPQLPGGIDLESALQAMVLEGTVIDDFSDAPIIGSDTSDEVDVLTAQINEELITDVNEASDPQQIISL